MANLAGFDASQQKEMMDFSVMPAQKLVLSMMTASAMKPTKAGTGSFLECEFTIMAEGQYKGRKIWTRLNLSNPNKQAEDIAQRELGAICKAVGIIKPNDSADLHGRPMLIDFSVEKGENGGKDSNKIDKYTAVGVAQPQPQGFVVPQPVAGAPAPAAAVPAAPATPPWMRKP